MPFVYAQLPESRQSYVNDFAKVLSSEQDYGLEALLRDFEQQTKYEIAVVTVPSLGGYDVQQYAFELSEKWKIGKKTSDNGILVLLAPNERKVNISTGYGVESILTDAVCRKIINTIGIPYFKSGDYAEGLVKITSEITKILTDGAYRQKNYALAKSRGISLSGIVIVVFLILIILSIFFGGGSKTYSNKGGGSSMLFFPFLGGGFGGGGGSGSGGSGFGGFGGGSFGGGGSSGSW